jgi:hypothetical protein
MNNQELQHKIESAEDTFGVVTPNAIHDQLNSLTPADWRQAAQLYKPNASAPNGFHITDDASGKVTVHNDIRSAQADANSPLNATVNDAKSAGDWALGAVGIGGAASAGWGIFNMTQTAAALSEYGAYMGWGGGVAAGDLLATGAVAAGEAALVAGAVIGAGAAAVGAGDLARNALNQSQAKSDVATASSFSWQPK